MSVVRCQIESCDWLSAWHMNKKSTYLRLQCDYMELFYDESKVSDYIREIMRVNCFCVKASTKAVAFDFENENYNLYLKQTPIASRLDLAILRSRHVMCGMKARIEMAGSNRYRKKQLARGASEEEDVIMLEALLTKCLVFTTHQPLTMHRDYFWKSVHPPVGVGSHRDIDKTSVAYTEHEREMLNRLTGDGSMKDDNNDDDESSNGSRDESIHGEEDYFQGNNARTNNVNSDSSDDDCELTSEELAKKASDALKYLGNVRRKELDKSATKDVFLIGKVVLKKSLSKKRIKALKKLTRKREMIFESMDYFQSVMAKRRQQLDDSIERSQDNSYSYHRPEWKSSFKNYMKN